MWRVLVSIVTALGATVLARTYTEEPKRTTVVSGVRTVGAQAAAPGEQNAPEHGTQTTVHPGWSRPKPEIIPRATYWPVLLAGGISFVMWGLISNVWVFGVGLILFFVSMIGWVNDLLNE